jgi:monoamine oxidase
VPLGVLQAPPDAEGAIRFQPPLPPAVRAAAVALAMGNVTKVVLRFNRIPWPGLGPGGLGFLHVPGGVFPTFWTLAERPRPVVVAWAAGPAADRLPTLSPEALRRAALQTLARASRRDLRELETFVDGASVADWGADPFARGAYSWVPVGALAAPATLAQPIEDTLILAGEATETSGHAGTVHGALMTGERAARDARSALRRR